MDLFGWDTIFATTLSKANQALRAGMANLVSSFTFSESGFDLTGAFAPWQMVTGGAGKLLHMQVPIVSGTMKSGSGSIDLAGLSVTVEVSLQLLPSQAGAGASDLVRVVFALTLGVGQHVAIAVAISGRDDRPGAVSVGALAAAGCHALQCAR